MLSSPRTFTPLPNEQILYSSPDRTTFSLQSMNKFPGHVLNITSSSGVLHLTDRRIVYLPSAPSPNLQSFAAPIVNLKDSHLITPWIGPNTWAALVKPVPGGNLSGEHGALELNMTFKDGGAYDFQSRYERVRERLHQAIELARNNGTMGEAAQGGLGGVNMDNVHLEDLPAYEEREGGISAANGVSSARRAAAATTAAARTTRPQQPAPQPDDAPPGYEEVQRSSVADEVERRLSGSRKT